MKSEILTKLGLADLDAAYIFITIIILFIMLLIINIIQGIKISKLNKKYNKFMQGKDAKSLEQSIVNLFESNRIMKESSEDNHKRIRELTKNQKFAFQKMGLVKYDAFKQMGGELSFCIAMLNANNDGYIINTVHSTDGSYTYTKEIKNGESKLALGEEEKVALEKALS